MEKNRIPIDGEPCGILAIPIPESGDLRFAELIRRYYDALGKSGGDRILWRPIDDPRMTDDAYERLRTNEQKESDEYSAKKYDSYKKCRGGADHHLAREYNTLAENLDVSDAMRPCVFFATNPPVGPRPILHLSHKLLETRELQNQLGDFLVSEFCEGLVEEVLEDGYLTEDSMLQFEYQIRRIEREAQSIDAQIRRAAINPTPGSYTRYVSPSGVELLDKVKYEEIKEKRGEIDLLIDVIGECVFCRSGRSVKMIFLRKRAIRILAEIIEADRPVRPNLTPTGSRCETDRSAYNTFYEGRKVLRDSLKGAPQLFRISRGLGKHESLFEFNPPKTLKWALLLPVNHHKSM